MKQQSIFRKFTLNNQGQAVVEYVLLTIVVVSLLLATRGLFTSLNTYMSDGMGKYIVCLMEYGELPALGVQEADLKNHQGGAGRQCQFQKFSSLMATNSANTKDSTSSTSSDSNSTNSSAEKNDSGGKSSSSKSSAADSSADSGSATKRSSYGRGNVARSDDPGAADRGVEPNQSKIKEIEADADAGPGSGRGANQASASTKRVYEKSKSKAITGVLADQIEKNSKKSSRNPSSKVMSVSEEGYRFKLYKKTFNPPKADQVVEDQSKDETFSVGNLMKWLIIAGILIACFILFGGQILNYSNSSDS